MRSIIGASGLWAALVTAALAATGDELVITGDGVNVRAEPNSSSTILLQVYHDEPVTELAREGEWVQVELSRHNTRGWIHQSLLAPVGGQEAAAEPAPAIPSEAQARAAPSGAQPPAVSSEPQAPAARAPEPQPTEAPPAALSARPAPASPPVEPGPSAPTAPQPAPGAASPEVSTAGVAIGESAPFEEFRRSVQYLNNRAVTAAGVDLFTDVRSVGDSTVQVVTTDAWQTVPQAGQQSYLNALYNSWLLVAGPDGERTVQIVDAGGEVVLEKTGP